MISIEEKLIDEITATFHYLRTGSVPPPIPIPDDLPDNEMHQLITFLNRFLTEFAPFVDAMDQIAQGELEVPPLLGRIAVVQSFKALQSNLKHLTWKTQQIAAGDLEQKVDFMGDFSVAFNSMTQQLKDSYEQLERRNQFIRKTFGRYTSDEIVEALLDMPDGLKLGGEKREVTLLMSDLRGFTALAEQLEAAQVVSLLNHYLSAMVGPIQRHGGTIDEIIGDAILVLFGAPLAMEDAALRAVRCALEMQKAMGAVNEHNIQKRWPEIEMGIAVHTGEVVVGNIGSTKRSKYGVVGGTVNLTARIESFTVGGQVLVSPALMGAAKGGLILGDEIEVHAKGMQEAITCRELLGHEAHPELVLEEEETRFTALARPLPVHYVRLTDKHLGEKTQPATLVSLSQRQAVFEAADPLPRYANIMLRLKLEAAEEETSDLYAKVIRPLEGSSKRYIIHFTSVPPRMRERLDSLARMG
ncbi:MAG: adenylate/guanylate cyclase domain-containing protein [Desulfobacteraceae bacterium]|jgi:adenylate cyclase